MSIKKFIISAGDGELEESELDSSGQRTIGYDDVEQRVQLSKAYVIGNLYVSGSIIGTLTGSVSGSATGGGGTVDAGHPKVKFTKQNGPISVGDVVSLSSDGLIRSSYGSNEFSNVIGVVVSSGSEEIYVQTSGEAEIGTIYGAVTTGSTVWAYLSGTVSLYSNLSSGNYATQVGYISGNGPLKIIIQPRPFGQLG